MSKIKINNWYTFFLLLIALQSSAWSTTLKIAPVYPPKALEACVEGYVQVQFEVTENGKTANVRVLNAVPEGYFEEAAIKQVKKYKYEPRIIDGKAVLVKDVETFIYFKLDGWEECENKDS